MTSQETKFYDRYKKYFNINNKIIKLVDRTLHSKIIKHENNPLKMTAVYFVIKAIKTHMAILHLCSKGYGEDAAILIRSLLNLIINIFYIASRDSENRARQFIAHAAFAKLESYNIYSKYPEILDKSKSFDINEIKKEAIEAQNQYGFEFGKPWSKKTILQMAKDIDMHSSPKNNNMEKNYDVVYNYLSNFEHSNAISANSYITDRKKGWDALTNPTDNLLPETLASDAGYFLTIFEKFCDIFKLDAKKEIQTLCAELRNLKNNN